MLILRLMIIEVKCTHTSFVGSCQQSGAKVTRYAMKQSICRAHLNKTEQMMLCHLLSQRIVSLAVTTHCVMQAQHSKCI